MRPLFLWNTCKNLKKLLDQYLFLFYWLHSSNGNRTKSINWGGGINKGQKNKLIAKTLYVIKQYISYFHLLHIFQLQWVLVFRKLYLANIFLLWVHFIGQLYKNGSALLEQKKLWLNYNNIKGREDIYWETPTTWQ